MWKLIFLKQLTHKPRVDRHMSNDPYCPKCDWLLEDSLHAIRHCPLAKGIWMEAELVDPFFSMEFYE